MLLPATTKFVIASLLLVSFSLQNADAQHQAHVHGTATLNILNEGNALIIELISPAANIVGFEHTPQNAAQRQQISQALSTLQNVDSIVDIGPTGCTLAFTEVNVTGVLANELISRPDQPVHQHDHNHNHDNHDDHDHSAADGHAEFQVKHQLDCQPRGLPDQLNITAFEHFIGIERLTAQWLTDVSQGVANLNRQQHRLRLRP
jgi:hypothetical protein